ncbi:MAG: nuclear transport factor 2 family protein [Flavobacteriales bacterium]
MHYFPIIPFVLALLLSLSSAAQTTEVPMTFAGTHPPDSAVLALLAAESAIMEQHRHVSVRDSMRKELLSPGWFYHGIDGMPIDLKGLTARQTRNGFKMIEASVMREILYQYENTAILVLHEHMTLEDKGERKEVYGSLIMVLGKENGRWVIQAEAIGSEPPAR